MNNVNSSTMPHDLNMSCRAFLHDNYEFLVLIHSPVAGALVLNLFIVTSINKDAAPKM